MKLFGIPLKFEPAFFLIAVFLSLGRMSNLATLVEWILVVTVSILLHEFGHALAARAFGLSPQIRLYQMGGQTYWHSETELSPFKHLLISLAGPAVGLIFGGLVLLLGLFTLVGSDSSEFLSILFVDLLWVNIGWSLFNLLPMLPLDGGSVIAALEAWLLRRKDRLVSHSFSLLVALAIAGWAFSRRWLWIAFLGIYFAYTNAIPLFKKFQAHRDRGLAQTFDDIRAAINRNEYDRALELITQIERRAKSAEMKEHAAYLRVMTFFKQEDFARAEDEVGRYTALYGESFYLQGALRFLRGDMQAALPYLQSSFEQDPDTQVGLMIFKCLIAQKSFAGALDFCRHPALAEHRWVALIELQTEAFNQGAFDIAVKAGTLAGEEKPEPRVAYNVACALAQLGQTTEAIDWLSRAIQLGFADKDTLRSDPDLAAIRSMPEFDALIN